MSTFERYPSWRRIRRDPSTAKVLAVVLLLVFSTLPGGCRNGETVTTPSQPVPFVLNFPVGARFTYSAWTLDERYPQSPSGKGSTSWTVLQTQEQYQGMSNVTVIADSAGAGTDTLYLATSSSGDLYFYGYLARLARRRTGTEIPPRWDLVAAFSTGTSGSWTVGPVDSLGEDIVRGSNVGASDYYSASVDGVTEVFPTYRVDLTGSTLLCSLWFSSSPSTIVRLLDEPDYPVTGSLQELAVAKLGSR